MYQLHACSVSMASCFLTFLTQTEDFSLQAKPRGKEEQTWQSLSWPSVPADVVSLNQALLSVLHIQTLGDTQYQPVSNRLFLYAIFHRASYRHRQAQCIWLSSLSCPVAMCLDFCSEGLWFQGGKKGRWLKGLILHTKKRLLLQSCLLNNSRLTLKISSALTYRKTIPTPPSSSSRV